MNIEELIERLGGGAALRNWPHLSNYADMIAEAAQALREQQARLRDQQRLIDTLYEKIEMLIDNNEQQRAEIEEHINAYQNCLQERTALEAEIERLRTGINLAGALALQRASHEYIRQVLADVLNEQEIK